MNKLLVACAARLLVAVFIAILPAPSSLTKAQDLQQALKSLRGMALIKEAQELVEKENTKSIHEGIVKYSEAAALFHEIGLIEGEAAALIGQGMAYATLEERENAVQHLERAIPMTRTFKEPFMQATALAVLGFIYSSSNQFDKAVAVYEQGLVVMKDHDDARHQTIKGGLYTGLGLNYVLLGEQKKGFESLERALALKRKLKDPSGEAQILTSIGATYRQIGQTAKALEYDHRALEIAQSLPDKVVHAMSLGVLGAVYRDLGQNDKALEYFNRELSLRQTIGDHSNVSTSLNRIAGVYANMNDTANAFSYFKQALQIKRDSSTLNNLGELYSTTGEFQQAMEFYIEALSLTRQENDRKGQASTLTNIGALYVTLGEPENAIDNYNEALRLMRAMNSPTGESAVLGHIGNIHIGMGRKHEALGNYKRALQLSQGADRFGELNALVSIGSTYSELGNKQEALKYYERAMPIAQAIRDRLGVATIINNTGDIHRSQGRLKRALELYEEALTIVREVGDRSKEVSTLGNIAKTKRDMGDLGGAQTAMEAALAILESLRTKIGSQDLRFSYFAKGHAYYEFQIDLLMSLHKRSPGERLDLAALQLVERSRARSLNELLIESRANIRQGIDPQLLDRERSLRQQINAKAFTRLRLSRIPNTAEQLNALAKETVALINELQQVEGRIRQTSPRYAALTRFEPLDAMGIQAQLDPDTLLLQYSLGKDRSYLWVVSTTGIKSFELPAAKEIERAALAFIGVLHTPRDIYSANTPPTGATSPVTRREIMDNAVRLSEMLLGPVASELKEKRLVIVADGVLQTLPFAALPDNPSKSPGAKIRPLIVQHEIVNLPSISALATLRNDSPAAATKDLFVLADPVFNQQDERLKQKPGNDATKLTVLKSKNSVGRGGTEFERLPDSRTEAEGIAAFLPENNVTKVLDFDANRAALNSDHLRQYRYVHFATHGSIDSNHPELTSIVLSLVDQDGKPQDGFFRAHEVYNLKLDSDLVVLSACDTGRGRIIKGEGLIGLTRGFMYAGTRRVVASLWRVKDESTAQLMVSFYRRMIKEGKRPAEALRMAQLEMLNGDKWQAPHYWAAFVLQGEWR